MAFKTVFNSNVQAFRNKFPEETHCTRLVIHDPFDGSVTVHFMYQDDWQDSIKAFLTPLWINGSRIEMDTDYLVNEELQRKYYDEDYKRDQLYGSVDLELTLSPDADTE